MYKINDYLIYKKDVCKIIDIKTDSNNISYYVLVLVDDSSLTIKIPIENSFNIRDLISKDEAYNLINNILNIEPIKDINDKNIENTYKELLKTGKHEDLIKIIKTTYLRNKNRIDNKKKLGDKDTDYFNKAERYLYNELAIVLNMSYDEVKEYILNRVLYLENN